MIPRRNRHGRLRRAISSWLPTRLPEGAGGGTIAAWPPILLTLLAIVTFLVAANPNDSVTSLILTRPLTMIVLALGLRGVEPADLRKVRWPIGLTIATIALTLLHLVPLPPSIWTRLPERDVASSALATAGIAQPWLPLSIAPWRTWNVFFFLFVPLATIVLMARVGREQMVGIFLLMLAIALLSAGLALFHIVTGGPEIPYFYDGLAMGQIVGLFSNRNHQASLMLCLLPMLAACSALPGPEDAVRLRRIACAFGGAILIPLIVVIGSRAALLLLPLAVACTVLVNPDMGRRASSTGAGRWLRSLMPGLIMVALILVTIVSSRAVSFERFLHPDPSELLRAQLLSPELKLIRDYLPFGSGIGTFVEAYQIAEPRELLRESYVNHAHNDPIEVMITAGLPGAALILLAIAAFVVALARQINPSRRSQGRFADVLARLGLSIILLLAAESLFNFPLREPSLAILCAVAAVWSGGARVDESGAGARSGDGLPGRGAQVK